METTKTKHHLVNNKVYGRYEFDLGDDMAVIDYQLIDGGRVAVFTHTGVPPAYEGQGIASELTHAALSDCRAAGKKVIPACSFAALYVKRHPEWEDIVVR